MKKEKNNKTWSVVSKVLIAIATALLGLLTGSAVPIVGN
jgi:hypothetical protein